MDLSAASKAGLLKDLAGRAAAILNLSSAAVCEAIAKRDELGSTGIGHGVSIPHARLREIKTPGGWVRCTGARPPDVTPARRRRAN